jgi:hypothetical protein
MVVPRVKLMAIKKESMEREDCILHQPFPIRPAQSNHWASAGLGIRTGDVLYF